MRLRCRPMQPHDAKASVALVAETGLERQRYSNYLQYLPEVWANCLHHGSLITSVIEDADRLSAGIQVVGVSAFVTDDFVEECKRAPLFWIGAMLVERFLAGNPRVLGPEAIREANSDTGVNVLVWADNQRRMSHVPALALSNEIARSFVLEHSGYKLKEILTQASDADIARYTTNTGPCLLLNENGLQTPLGAISAEFITRPFLLYFTRDIAVQNPGARSSDMFFFGEPRIYFSASEQKLLLAALRGGTDEELADEIGVSLSTVKKIWRSVYDRVLREIPDLLPSDPSDGFGTQRGREKKQRLLAYVREHPQELRPVSRRMAGRAGV